ncbi:MAG: hypothetical protein WAU33_14605 [Candidatus Binataceae bacterium]
MLDASMLVMIHSPSVGPLTWRLCSDLLQRKGYPVCIPSLRDFAGGDPPYYENAAEHIADAVRKCPRAEPVTLIAHSGAGALLPTIAEKLDQPCYAIFVDAILPHPGRSWFDTAPPVLSTHLRGLARNGLLPPWHEWFPPEVISALIPDPNARQRFIGELPRIRVAYLEERAPTTGADRFLRCGYLQLSDGYGAFANKAGKAGWVTLRASADHLAVLTRPEVVCTALVSLLEALGI